MLHPSNPSASAPLGGIVPLYAGVHLSGSNANKTSLTILEGNSGCSPLEAPLKIRKVYEKIGSFGTLFSDDRLVEVLNRAGPFAQVFVDCPLTVPPCVACQRPVCPGAVQCDDLSVAYMLSISSRVRRKGARRARPVNPQSQRLWDVLHLDDLSRPRAEPSYSANLAPLVTRAMTLQRRLNSLVPRIELKETSISNTLEAMRRSLRLHSSVKSSYRAFETGLDLREEIVDRMVQQGWIDDESVEDQGSSIGLSVETFHSFLAAWVGALHDVGLTHNAPQGFIASEGWVYVPDIERKAPVEPQYF